MQCKDDLCNVWSCLACLVVRVMPDDVAVDVLIFTSALDAGTAASDSDDDDDDDGTVDVVVWFCVMTVAGILTGTDSPPGDSTIT